MSFIHTFYDQLLFEPLLVQQNIRVANRMKLFHDDRICKDGLIITKTRVNRWKILPVSNMSRKVREFYDSIENEAVVLCWYFLSFCCVLQGDCPHNSLRRLQVQILPTIGKFFVHNFILQFYVIITLITWRTFHCFVNNQVCHCTFQTKWQKSGCCVKSWNDVSYQVPSEGHSCQCGACTPNRFTLMCLLQSTRHFWLVGFICWMKSKMDSKFWRDFQVTRLSIQLT